MAAQSQHELAGPDSNLGSFNPWVSDDLLALLMVLTVVVFAIIELRKPYLEPGIKTVKQSYLTNVGLFLFNDITLSVLSIPTLFLAA